MSNRTLPLGIAIIVAGLIVMLGKLGLFSTLGALLWPLLLLAAGAGLYLLVWNRTLPPVALLPGGTLAALSVLFLFHAWFGWESINATWPLILLSIAIGLYVWASAVKHKQVRSLAYGLGVSSLALFFITLAVHANGFVVALLFIIAGVILIARRPNFR